MFVLMRNRHPFRCILLIKIHLGLLSHIEILSFQGCLKIVFAKLIKSY